MIQSRCGASDLRGISQLDTAVKGRDGLSHLPCYTSSFELPRSQFEPKAARLIVAFAIGVPQAHRRLNLFAKYERLNRKLCPAVQVGNP
jgi:hypothetical protein